MSKISKAKIEKLSRLGMVFWEYFRLFESESDRRSMLQSECLFYLSENGEVSMSELATHLKVSTPAVTNLIDRMVNKDLVERVHCEEDRRKILIKITNEGSQLLKQNQKEMQSEITQIFTGIGEQELDCYMATLEKMITNMKATIAKRSE